MICATIQRLLLLFFAATLTIHAQDREVLWQQDFENLDEFWENWHEEGDLWNVGMATLGPNAAFEGEHVAGTGLNKNVSGRVDARLIRHESFLVPGTDLNPRLELWQWRGVSQPQNVEAVELTIGDSGYLYDAVTGLAQPLDPSDLSVTLLSPDTGQNGEKSTSIKLNTHEFVTGKSISFRFEIDPRGGRGEAAFDQVLFNNSQGSNAQLKIQTPTEELTFTVADQIARRAYTIPITYPFFPNLRFSLTLSAIRNGPIGEGSFLLRNNSTPLEPINLSLALREPGGAWTEIAPENSAGEGTWQKTVYDLSPFSGKRVELAFVAQHEGANGTAPGWFLDQVRVVTGDFGFKGSESFDENLGDWLVENGNWAVGQAVVGLNRLDAVGVAGTNLAGAYEPGRTSRLVSPPFKVPPTTEFPHLKVDHWFDFGDPARGIIEVRPRGGDWITLSNEFGTFTDRSGNWTQTLISLAAFAEQNIQLAFTLQSSPNDTPRLGWYIDQLAIESQPPANLSFPEKFDAINNAWRASNGLWEINNGVAGTVLAGNYPAGTSSSFTSPPFLVPTSNPSPHLQVRQFFALLPGDRAEIEIRTAGLDWQRLGTPLRGRSGSWFTWEQSLARFANQEVELRFKLSSTATTGGESGWLIDSVDLVTDFEPLTFPVTFSDQVQGWSTTGGGWEFSETTLDKQGLAVTQLNRNYTPLNSTRLISPPLLVPAKERGPRLVLRNQYDFANGDSGQVQVKLGDSDWAPLIGADILTESSGGETNWELDLTPYGGLTIRLGFLLNATNASSANDGWRLSDIDLITDKPHGPQSDGFENSDGWYATRGVWQIGAPSSPAPQPKEGQQIAGTVIDGLHPTPTNSFLVSPPITIPPASEEPRLTFWNWFHLPPRAVGRLYIRKQGEEWGPWLEEISGVNETWTRASTELLPFSDQIVEIGFQLFHQLGSISPQQGWYLDDLKIETGRATIPNPESFEQGLSHWTVNGGSWEVGEPLRRMPVPRTGKFLAGTILDGFYGANVDARLISPPFNVPDAAFSPRLRFWHWRDLASGDQAQVEIIPTDKEADRAALETFTGSVTDSWKNGFVPLSAYAGQRVRIAFRLTSDGSDEGLGWFLDDVRLQTSVLTSAPVDRIVKEGENVLFDIGSAPTGLQLSVTPHESAWKSPFDEGIITDPDIPSNALVQLGIFTWQSTEHHGPATHVFRLNVVDPQSAWNPIDFEEFTIEVNEQNLPPTISPFPDQRLTAGQALTVTPLVNDPDFPVNTLTFTFDEAPQGATIDPQSGTVTWLPSAADVAAEHHFVIRVTDDGEPPLSTTARFIAAALGARPPLLTLVPMADGLRLQFERLKPNQSYRLSRSDNLTRPLSEWEVVTLFTANEATHTQTVPSPSGPSQFYAVTEMN